MAGENSNWIDNDMHREKGDKVEVLEQKQENILKRLKDLTVQLNLIKNDIVFTEPVASSNATTTCTLPSQIKDDGPLDIVIYANPSKPPLSLLVLLEQLKQCYQVATTSHVHSTISNVPAHLRNFWGNDSHGVHRGTKQLLLTLIWKDVNETQMMASPVKQSSIIGEANVARYLALLQSQSYSLPTILHQTEADAWIDTVHSLIVHGNSKERQGVLRSLNSHLGKAQYLVADSMSVADIFLWSALVQCKLTNELPTNVKRWFAVCKNDTNFRSIAQTTLT